MSKGEPFSVPRRSRLMLAAFLALGLVAAACSSSKRTATTSTTSKSGPSGSTASPSGTPLEFGIISTDTGTGAFGDIVATTIKDWAAYTNSHGGINGHPVKIDEMDDTGSTATAIQDATTLIQNDHVLAIGDQSQTGTAFASVAAQAHVPIISLGAATHSPDYLTDSNAFPNEETLLTTFWAMAKDAALSGNKNLGLLYCSEVAACAKVVPVVTPLATSLGVNVAYSASYSGSTPNYTAICLAAKDKGVNIIVPAGPVVAANQRVLDNCAQQGFHPVALLGGNAFDPQSLLKDSNIPLIYGYTGTVPWFVKSQATQAIDAAMGSVLQTTSTPNLAFDAWSGLNVFAAAAGQVASSATATPQDIYNGLYAMHGSTLGGLTVPLTYTQGKPNPINCIFLIKADHGQLSVLLNGQPACQTPAAGS